MKFIADFHIHSHFSLATSSMLTPEYLDFWAKMKGIDVVGLGDFTHDGWLNELQQKLEPAEQGLYRLKKEYIIDNPINTKKDTRFILTAEISNIYKKEKKTRKVHNILFAPDFEIVNKIRQKLINLKFNLKSDGRPILGLDSQDLLEICLEASSETFLIPAHIWTPWFSVLGSKSGFDSIEQCFGHLSSYIKAVETGLSTNPPLNWMCSILDKYTLVSNSDAHSPEKLGRNANIFETELSYNHIINAMKNQDSPDFHGTIDMYPQEGKYHYDGHRKCKICWNPVDTLQNKGICTVCGKPITIGVVNRIAELSDRHDITERKNRKPFYSIIPLKEILAEIHGLSSNTKTIDKNYFSLIQKAGCEFDILLHKSIEEIKQTTGELIAEAIRRMRGAEVILNEGYDGQYGTIKVFTDNELKHYGSKNNLFELVISNKKPETYDKPLLNFDLKAYRELQSENPMFFSKINFEHLLSTQTNNSAQQAAIKHEQGSAMVIAGPGSGKTYVLTQRIAYLIKEKEINPENILAITFTNKAASEMKTRLNNLLNSDKAKHIDIFTFHAFGYQLLKKLNTHNCLLINDSDKEFIFNQIGVKKQAFGKLSQYFSKIKAESLETENIENEFKEDFYKYQNYLKKNNLLDLDDLIFKTISILKDNADDLKNLYNSYQYILIDEFQDINQSQFDLIKLLSQLTKSQIFAIGDPNQAIYGFRGSNIEFINKFIAHYNAKEYKLNTSYRCSDQILKASGNILQLENQETIIQGIQKGIKIKIVQNVTDKSEAEFIARTIENMMGGLRFFSIDSNVTENQNINSNFSLSDFAVLCRTKSQFAAIIEAFQNHAIPFQTIGDTPFYKHQPFSQIIDFIRLIKNPENQFLLNKTKISDSSIPVNYQNKTPLEITEKFIETFLKPDIKVNHNELIAFKEICKKHNSDINSFISEITTGSISDDYDSKTENVTIMTLHASKGLEFECVFIAGCEHGLIPFTINRKNTDLDEEKRLMYVGMTRAKQNLFLTYSLRRNINNREWKLSKSTFIDQIEKKLTETQKTQHKQKIDPNAQLRLF